MHFRDMPYQRVPYEEIEADYQALFRDVQAARCEADCLAVLRKHNRLCDRMTPMDLCYVRHGMDVNDPFYAGEQAYYDEVGPRISALQQQFHRLLVTSPFAAFFEETLGSFAFSILRASLKSSDSRLIPLEQEENALLSRYNHLTANAKADYNGAQVSRASLTRDQQSPDRAVRRRAYEAAVASWEAQRDDLEEIFDALVDNRDRQARMLGYPGFVPMSYMRMNRIGYTPEDVRCFREQVKACLVPLAAELNERRRKRLGLERLYPYDQGVFFPEGNPAPLGDDSFCLEMTRQMYGSLSPRTKEYIDFVLDNGLYDVTMREGKQPGGYCMELGAYRAPFIFANFDGTSENAYIMTHEGGHGFYCFLKRNGEIRERGWYTPEMAETHAMSMECFTLPYMELFFGSRAGDYRAMYLEKAVSLILYQCQQDEFQQIIYDRPRLTRPQRNEAWARLERDYFPFREYPGDEAGRAGTRWQRIPHVFLWPFYAIDYALAQVCALQYLRLMHEQPAEAWNSYMTFLDASGNQSFPEALRTAGLESPFAPGSLDKLMNWLRTQL
ncbi:MAG: M3 family oligoendopeptidase [Aristaeellaceae bacterium]